MAKRPALPRAWRGIGVWLGADMIMWHDCPLVRARVGEKEIVGLFSDVVVRVDGERAPERLDVVNAKASGTAVLASAGSCGEYRHVARDGQGRRVGGGTARPGPASSGFDLPASGLLALARTR